MSSDTRTVADRSDATAIETLITRLLLVREGQEITPRLALERARNIATALTLCPVDELGTQPTTSGGQR